MDRKAFHQLLSRGALPSVLLFEGDDEYSKNAAFQALRSAVLPAGLEELNETLREMNGKLYADVAFQKVSFDSNFNYSLEGSRYYGAGYSASFGLVNPASYRNIFGLGYSENLFDIMSPKFLMHYVEKFSRKVQRYDVDGIS